MRRLLGLLLGLSLVACGRHGVPVENRRAEESLGPFESSRAAAFAPFDSTGSTELLAQVAHRGPGLFALRTDIPADLVALAAAPAVPATTVASETKSLPGDPSCGAGMALVEGESCWDVQHTCLERAPNDPGMRCLEFKKGADTCLPPKKPMRFCMDRYEWPGVIGAKPRVLTNYFEAEAACKSVGKRMCQEQEFYLACEGPEHWPFAWGHVRHPSPCNVDRPYFMVEWSKWGSAAGRLEEAKRLDQALPIGASQCWSPYGIHDIAGNVDEWTTAQPGRELKGSLNGGYWGPVPNACRYVTLVHGPEFAFYQIGFRCCSEAKSP
jgi:formylglycine-generating enzyme